MEVMEETVPDFVEKHENDLCRYSHIKKELEEKGEVFTDKEFRADKQSLIPDWNANDEEITAIKDDW